MKIDAKNIDDLAHDQGLVAGEVERQEGVNEDDEKLADLHGGQVAASRGRILSLWLEEEAGYGDELSYPGSCHTGQGVPAPALLKSVFCLHLVIYQPLFFAYINSWMLTKFQSI